MNLCEHPLGSLDILQHRMSYAIDLVRVVWEGIENGYSAAESYSDALYATFDYLHGLSDEMREAVDAAFAEKRETLQKEVVS